MSTAPLTDQVLAVAKRLEAGASSGAAKEQARKVIERLQGPLRVAIAGRVKAGKSTLLNALVGERLAPTDAGECTRIVSWYKRGNAYEVIGRGHDGVAHPLGFNRAEGHLTVKLGELTEKELIALEVSVPTSALESITLIDTPGLASINDENSRRTRDFLEHDGDKPSDADAVIYLMRHAHRSDIAFLDAFMDRSVTAASPVNAVAVLSRSDEIGAGRLDALESSARIAKRYEADPQLRALCAVVTPMAGLLAETGLTLREDEVTALSMLARTDPAALELMLMSADQFLDISASELTVEIRKALLGRLGMFGVRLAIQEITAGRARTAAQLAPILVEQSGLKTLRDVIARQFMPRARVLQARSAIVALRSAARSMRTDNPALAAEVDRDLEQIESSTVQFAQVRAAHLLGSGAVNVKGNDRADLERLFSPVADPIQLGLASTASDHDLCEAAMAAASRWRVRGADPLADLLLTEVCDVAARTCESIYAAHRPS
jgi:hypothetical protein